jgi:hypothetical protein
MVRAILDGRKTQTRRIIKPQPRFAEELSGFVGVRCPYGVPGGLLWVRETWAIDQCGRRVSLKPEAWPDGFPVQRLRYPATDEAPATTEKGEPYWWNSRPSIHMPRWASRLTLRVTDVRVERLQEITEEDAGAEGVVVHPNTTWRTFEEAERGEPMRPYAARDAFAGLWGSINGKRAPWESNPWTWVVSFERVSLLGEPCTRNPMSPVSGKE